MIASSSLEPNYGLWMSPARTRSPASRHLPNQPQRGFHLESPDELFIHPMPTAVTAPNLPERKRPVIVRLGTMTQQSYQTVALDDSRPNPSIRLLIAMKLIATPLAQSTGTTMH